MPFKKLMLATAMAPFAVLAESPSSTEIISVTGYPQELDKIIVSAEVIELDEIQTTAAADIADILRFHAGIEIGRTGGPGQQTSAFIRGAESDHTLVLIDGLPINSASVGSAAIQNIDPQAIERIEIVKGPQSVTWGSNAIGGVINVITRKSAGAGLSYGGALEAGSNNTARISGHAAHADQSLALDASLSYQQTDGFPTLAASNIDRGFDNSTANLGLSAAAGAGRISARYWQAQGNSEYLDYFMNPLDQDFLNSAAKLGWEGNLQPDWETSLEFSQIRDEIEQNQTTEAVKTRRTEIKWWNKLALSESGNLVAGLNADQEKVRVQGGWSPYQEDSDYWEAFAQYDGWFAERHHLGLGARYLDHESAGDHLTWSLGYGYAFSDATILNANVATGFKIPTANERFGYGGNQDLKPEEATSYELALKHDLDESQSIHAALFRNDIDNLIQWTLVTPPWEGYNQNIAKTRIEGLELGYQLAMGDLDLDLNATWQDPRDLSSDSQLLRRAEFNFSGRLSYAWSDLNLGANLLYAGERQDFGSIVLDPYWLVNLDASYALDKDWSLFAKVENLLDEDYELAYGYNTQGLTGYVGIRYR